MGWAERPVGGEWGPVGRETVGWIVVDVVPYGFILLERPGRDCTLQHERSGGTHGCR